jgi:hypothetical protein
MKTYSLEEITIVENLYRSPEGRPSLGQALEMLIHRWRAGARDEPTLIRLLFLLWYQNCEPPFLTGLSTEPTHPSFEDVFESAGGEAGASPQVLWIVARMAEIFPWAVGEEAVWKAAADRLSERVRPLKPGLSAADRADWGAAGDYFRSIDGLT